MSDETSSSSSKSTKSSKASDKTEAQTAYEQALETGVLGTTHDELDNDAYTVGGQGEETAAAEREAHERIRSEQRAASTEQG